MENYSLVEGLVSRSNQDGTVIIMKMDEGNNFFKINGVAAFFWKELSQNKKTDEIVLSILENYETSKEEVERDVLNFIKVLIEKELIVKAK